MGFLPELGMIAANTKDTKAMLEKWRAELNARNCDVKTVAERGMTAARIIKAFDEFEDGDARLGVGLEPLPVEQLAFEGGEEAFRHRIIVGVAD